MSVNLRYLTAESSESRRARGLRPKEAVPAGTDIANELFEAIRAELVGHHGEFTAADAIRITNLGMMFLQDFTAIDKHQKHKILSDTIRRVVEEVDMPDDTRELLTALFGTSFFDGVIRAAVELYNLAQQAVLAKFDLDHNGAVSLQEVQQGPPQPRPLLAAPPPAASTINRPPSLVSFSGGCDGCADGGGPTRPYHRP